MLLQEIFNRNELSVRSYHLCRYNDLNNIQDILNYFFKNNSFEKLRNCGKKSNLELIALCRKYQDNYDYNTKFSEVDNKKLENPTVSLTRFQRETINNFILVLTNTLSVRSRNALKAYLEGNLKIKVFFERRLLDIGFDFTKIKNVGKKCIPELQEYILKINFFLNEIKDLKDERHLLTLKNNFLIQNTYFIDNIPKQVLESESIFLLVDFLLNQNAFFDKSQTEIIKKTLKLYLNNHEFTLDQVATESNLTRERVRQIRNKCLEELFDKLLFIQNFNEDLLRNYGIDINSQTLDIDSQTLGIINSSNGINYTREFVTYILYVYLNDRFSLIGNIEDILQPKFFNSRDRHNWTNFYLIQKGIASKIKTQSFVDDIDLRLKSRIEESYSFNFKSYLSTFIIDFEILDLALPIMEKIINEEFEIYLDLEENIVFQRNTIKQVYEYGIEVLELLGEPSKIEEIYNLIQEKFPDVTKSKDALRSSLQRATEVIYFGRSSTYGLKKWEEENDDIKGGTIKNLVYDYLLDKETPVHVNELVEEVNKYREDTNSKNIITNLKLDPQKQFIIFNQKFIGLKHKSYESNLIGLPKFLGKSITQFIRSNNYIHIDDVSNHFGRKYKIDSRNMNHILQQLIDSEFIFIDKQKKIFV
ncbi:sigma factor-like helix-turn-helix DNA-binding protein [Flavobacterium rakeshii]|uniref:sigma factor-like helix-turn-helix DNA-binding protein n=1 Tax=Flavobacterium rakeshii TaxID=1038845 RepID=UPI002E7AC21E|nr:sigma factor-like helix-turn-helix DNA-binding protein [Flavobacterium rakeshii]MEE1897447.1 sigma factor-like helix-turn-helix DNA-binding protein [Flavobacterium rakeshii]